MHREYAVLGLLTAGVYIAGGAADAGKVNDKKKADIRNSKKRTPISRGILIPWVVTTAYAATDEMHQLFVPGRSGQVSGRAAGQRRGDGRTGCIGRDPVFGTEEKGK